jgi:IS5 family transposase
MRGKDLFAAMRIDAIRDEIAHYCGLGERVIDQARRRVLEGEQVPNAEKIYSIFEPHTDLIQRSKSLPPRRRGCARPWNSATRCFLPKAQKV